MHQLTLHKIAAKLQKVINLLVADPKSNHKDLQNQIDRVKTDCMLSAEKKCRQYCMGQVDYSPELKLWRCRKDTWQLIVKYYQGNQISRSLIRRQASICKIENPLSGTLDEALKAYSISKDTYYKLRHHAPEYRKAHLRDRVHDAKRKKQHQRAKEILQLILRESIRDEWKRINGAVQQ